MEFQLLSGKLFGSASGSTIIGNVNNSGASIDAGGTTGTLTIAGMYTQGSGGELVIGVDVNGGTNSKLHVEAFAVLGGKLTINWSNGTPAAGSEYEVAHFGSALDPPVQDDFTQFRSTGEAFPGFFHMAGTFKPYKIKVN